MKGESRRSFLTDVGRLATTVALVGAAPASAAAESPAPSSADSKDWDLRWIDQLKKATDRAVFDWPSLGDPADPIVLELAERYLDNCASAYKAGSYNAKVVLNIRTQAVSAGLSDDLWQRYSLGAEYSTKDPNTQQPAVKNPFMYRAPSPAPGIVLPSLADLMNRGAIILVCDFAMTNLSKRLAPKFNKTPEEVHADIRAHLVRGAYAVPSGIFGLIRAQNAGCGYMRL